MNRTTTEPKTCLEGDEDETGAEPSSRTWWRFSLEVLGASQRCSFFPRRALFSMLIQGQMSTNENFKAFLSESERPIHTQGNWPEVPQFRKELGLCRTDWRLMLISAGLSFIWMPVYIVFGCTDCGSGAERLGVGFERSSTWFCWAI